VTATEIQELEAAAVLRVPALLSVGTTARLLDCSPRTVRRRIAEGSLPAVVDHGRTLVRADELREYIDRLQRVGPHPPQRRRNRAFAPSTFRATHAVTSRPKVVSTASASTS